MTLAAGRLRHWILLQRLDYVRDSNGDIIQDPNTGATEQEWVDVDNVWAAKEPLSAREFIASQAIQSQVSEKFVIRYRSDVNATWRVVYRGKIYNIEGILSDKDSGFEYLTLPVSEGVNNG